MQQAAGRAATGVVVDGEDAAPRVDAGAEGVPEAARDLFELFAVGGAVKHAAADAGRAFNFFAIGAEHRVWVAKVFAEAEN